MGWGGSWGLGVGQGVGPHLLSQQHQQEELRPPTNDTQHTLPPNTQSLRNPNRPQSNDDASIQSHGLGRAAGAAVLALWVAVLAATIALARALPSPPLPLKWFEAFYRIGSIIYGGGQVVLPMLYQEVVQRQCDAATGACADAPNTWVTSKQFYAGLGVVQALPGPLFNFSAYLGAIAAANSGLLFLWGALLAWFGLFTPGILVRGVGVSAGFGGV